MTYQEAETFLFSELQSFQDKGRKAFNGTLENALSLSELLGQPEKKFASVHVAGTNGKGSVSHIIAAGLQANGYKVGLYTSPHYRTYRERIKINVEFIQEEEVANFIKKYKEDIKRIKPSFFEITCAMAFDHFATHQVDVAVIEVGLGGRLDSTNIIRPLLSVVTNISFDHQHILGNTIEEIAGEKAGIFKSQVPVVIGEKQTKTTPVFESKANEVDTQLFYAEEDATLVYRNTKEEDAFLFEIKEKDWTVSFDSDLTNPYQIKNLKTALFALYHLMANFKLDVDKIAHGVKNIHQLTYFIGRWTTVQEKPKVIFDSAHNSAGVGYLAKQLKKMEYDTLRIIWGTTKEKDVNEILDLLPTSATYYFCHAQNSRAMDATDLRQKASTKGLSGYAYNSVKGAYQCARAEASPRDLIIVSGSSFVVSEVV